MESELSCPTRGRDDISFQEGGWVFLLFFFYITLIDPIFKGMGCSEHTQTYPMFFCVFFFKSVYVQSVCASYLNNAWDGCVSQQKKKTRLVLLGGEVGLIDWRRRSETHRAVFGFHFFLYGFSCLSNFFYLTLSVVFLIIFRVCWVLLVQSCFYIQTVSFRLPF